MTVNTFHFHLEVGHSMAYIYIYIYIYLRLFKVPCYYSQISSYKDVGSPVFMLHLSFNSVKIYPIANNFKMSKDLPIFKLSCAKNIILSILVFPCICTICLCISGKNYQVTKIDLLNLKAYPVIMIFLLIPDKRTSPKDA